MRVLDMDLDFFFDDVAYYRKSSGDRLTEDYHPWDEAAVRQFLEDRCGLCRTRPVPGKLMTHHHEAFLVRSELIQSGVLTIPFDVVHVDAHADLGGGFGDVGYIYLMTDVLPRPLEERMNLEIGERGLYDNNYLAFAVACRWIRRIVYVPNPRSRNDLPCGHFKNLDEGSGMLQLKACDQKGFDAICRKDVSYPFRLEPEIPFQKTLASDFRDTEGFSFAVLCQSPGFTPAASDALIPIVMEYLEPI